MSGTPPPTFDPAIAEHYRQYAERGRLERRGGLVEAARTLEILDRHLPPPPARVLDVGGGPGFYARILEERGYDVVLVDPSPTHVEIAATALRRGRARLGDARRLEESDASVDAVLLLGPLYHLTERADRLAALREARRVSKPGAPVFVAAISRFASTFDGMARGHLAQDAFARIVDDDLRDGRHRNESGRLEWFTTAYFHRPEELRAESVEAGLSVDAVVGLEGPTWLLPDVDVQWADPVRRERWMDLLRRLESEPSLLGVSSHVLAVGRRPR
jgi:ubiquinone/menaquinone biosynthesis C-methylase UbiE